MKYIVSLVALLCLLGSTALAQLYTFTRYGHNQGLEMSAIEGITQTPDGIVWMGTDGAELYAFDGQQFTPFQKDSTSLFHHAKNLSSYANKIQFASKYLGYAELDPSKGKTRMVKRSKHLGGEPTHFVRNDNLSLFASKCTILIEHQDGSSVKKSFAECDLIITQVIDLKDKLLVLSNKGDFISNGSGIQELDKWVSVEKIKYDYDFGYFHNSKLSLVDKTGTKRLEIVLNESQDFYSVREHTKSPVLHDKEHFIAFSFNHFSQTAAAITESGDVYTLDVSSGEIKYVITNQQDPLNKPTSIYVDRNGSIWIGTSGFGVYKLSKEIFTKIQILEEYAKQDIGFIYKTNAGVIILSYFGKETIIFSPTNSYKKVRYDFTINASELHDNVLWLATNQGLKKLNPETGEIKHVAFNNNHLTLVYQSWGKLYIGIAGIGLKYAEIHQGQLADFKDVESSEAYYFYCAQNTNKETLVFGSNDGLFSIRNNSNTLSRLKIDYYKHGGYSGVSTTDFYGNCWFTLDRSLVRINSKNKIEIFDATQLFKTNLLYTLQSDDYGNLFLGTNKGIFKIKTNKHGSIENISQFNHKNGFGGHETNMRAQFKSDEGLFIATIDGLYKISPEIFENLPIPSKPIITLRVTPNDTQKEFRLSLNNAINTPVKYIYRIQELSKGWKSADSINAIILNDLATGNYTLEVKATYDGINFSESSRLSFSVLIPVWRSNWFVLFAVGILVALNVILIRYNRAFNTSRLLESKDSNVYHKLTPGILLFGVVAISGSQFTALILEPELKLSFGPPMLISVTLICLLLMALSAKANKRDKEIYPRILLLGLISTQMYFFFQLFQSRIHPFHLLGVVLTSMIAPYVLQNLRQTIVYALIILACSLGLTLLIEEVVYNKSYFLIAVFVLACLIVFIGYLHHHSQERLLFISAIINKGNLPAIAFDSSGTIHYVSENISQFADASHQFLLKKNISYLNNYVPYEDKYKDTDVLKDFKEGEFYLVPMRNQDKQVRWVEWSYKQFTDELKVIIGQDVTEKMDLESTYELLVQSAEDFIYRCNVDGEFTFLNNISFEKLGYSKEELVGKSSLSIIDAAYRDEISNYYQDHFAQRKTTSYREFPIRSKEGALIWIGQHVTTLFAPGSNFFIKGFIALARDITDLRMQQELILEQRDSITSSIHYAKRIQNNLLPHERMFSNIFSDHFVLYKAKDIVSGDFYWMDDVDDYLIFALADCTGHGVPGAFMTLLGMNILNMIILEDKILEPGKILDRLDERLLEILPRGENESQVTDGMEITMCSLNKHTGELAYACAGSRFLMYKSQEFTMFKGDNKHIGDIHYEGFTHYETNYVHFAFGDEIILFTDGFQDQFGGPSDKKYSFRRFLEVFDEVIELPLDEQKIALKHEFDQWIGNGEQTDDLTVIALKR